MKNKTRKEIGAQIGETVQVSIDPAGDSFPLPRKEDYAMEFKRLEKIVKKQRQAGREIVVVMGVGFVGAVMAGVVADSEDRKTGESKEIRDRNAASLIKVFLENSIPKQGYSTGRGGRP